MNGAIKQHFAALRSYSRSGIRNEEKQLLFIRHGLSEMNERLQVMPWYSENFVDGALWDSKLSSIGIEQARSLHKKLILTGTEEYQLHRIEVLLSSPLTRALHTSELVFYDEKNLLPDVNRIVHPLLRERLYLSSEVGRCSSELKDEFPDWDLTEIPPGKPWWYIHNHTNEKNDSIMTHYHRDKIHLHKGSEHQHEQYKNNKILSEYSPYIEWRPEGRYCCEGEPNHVFTSRIQQLQQYILSRPEKYIAVVAHWGVLKALTGIEFQNCEARWVSSAEFLTIPDVCDE